ncbi:hypothetical protein Leryth_001090 [Lithospermum erythrorhizon]|nr:hypothetical protein Leryth_001090 [Lithospermum erythrorhizon]
MLVRTTQEKIKLGDLALPPEVELLLPVILIHHDTELWGSDAKEFNPQRFVDGVANASKNPSAFMPFSLGTRTCIGQNFVMQEAKMALAMCLQRFLFELSPSYQHGPFPLLTL